jgi:hypothetical protein
LSKAFVIDLCRDLISQVSMDFEDCEIDPLMRMHVAGLAFNPSQNKGEAPKSYDDGRSSNELAIGMSGLRLRIRS